jgi:hypothetical protein
MSVLTSATGSADSPGMPELAIWRLSVEQYRAMIRAGILAEDAPVELYDGRLVTKRVEVYTAPTRTATIATTTPAPKRSRSFSTPVRLLDRPSPSFPPLLFPIFFLPPLLLFRPASPRPAVFAFDQAIPHGPITSELAKRGQAYALYYDSRRGS